LVLDAQEEVGLRQQRILAADEHGRVANAGIEAHERWQRQRTETRDRASSPSLRVEPVTSAIASARAAAGRELVGVEQGRRGARSRPGGRRFGTLVHAILAGVPLDSDQETVGEYARIQGRLIGATEEEVNAAREAVTVALAHPLMRRAAAASELRREVPIQLRLPDGSLIEGVVDLAFREQVEQPGAPVGTWTIVDFKTDQEIAVGREQYEAQVGLYVRAIAQATGSSSRGVLLLI
jgi:ATP-dependent exoDNAse (exonuclease V) beta subunit